MSATIQVDCQEVIYNIPDKSGFVIAVGTGITLPDPPGVTLPVNVQFVWWQIHPDHQAEANELCKKQARWRAWPKLNVPKTAQLTCP